MKKDNKQRLFEVMERVAPNFNQNNYKKILADFPSHAKYVNPVDSPQYKWYQEVLQFMQGNNPVEQKSELVKFFQNHFIGMDYDVLQTPAETVSWWLSPEQQEFIVGELNSNGTPDELQNEEISPEQEQSQEESEFLPITAPAGSPDDKLFTDVVNQGIDSHLEGFTKSKFEIKNASNGNRRIFNFHKSEIPILLRRLEEIGTEEAQQWAADIQNYDANINEIVEELKIK